MKTIEQTTDEILTLAATHFKVSRAELQPGDDQIVGELVRRAAAIAKERGISASGFRAVLNTNRDGGQTVFHIHLHLLGGRSMQWPPG